MLAKQVRLSQQCTLSRIECLRKIDVNNKDVVTNDNYEFYDYFWYAYEEEPFAQVHSKSLILDIGPDPVVSCPAKVGDLGMKFAFFGAKIQNYGTLATIFIL